MSDADRPLDYAAPTADAAPRHAWIDPLVAGAVYVAGVAAIAGWPKSFAGADDRIAFSAPIAAGLGATWAAAHAAGLRVTRVRPRAEGSLALFVFALFCAIPAIGLAPAIQPLGDLPGAARWSGGAVAGLVAGLAVLALCLCAAANAVGRRAGPATARLLLLGMTAATAGLAAMTGSVRIAEKTAALAPVLALALLVGAAWRPARRANQAVTLLALAIIATQLATAHFWSDLARWQAACVLVAPLLAWAAASIPFVARRKPWLRGAIVILIAATPAIVACGIAAAQAYRASQASDASDYGY